MTPQSSHYLLKSHSSTNDFIFRAASCSTIFLPPHPHPSPSVKMTLSPVWLICDVALLCQLRHPSKQTDWQTWTHRHTETWSNTDTDRETGSKCLDKHVLARTSIKYMHMDNLHWIIEFCHILRLHFFLCQLRARLHSQDIKYYCFAKAAGA